MSRGARIDALLRWETAQLQAWLDGFYGSPTGRRRRATLGRTGEYIVIERLPLPDGYHPDEVDALLLVDQFPSLPPIGLYLLNQRSESVVRQLSQRFNAYRNRAFHDAQPIAGYTWVCYAYADNRWRYNAQDPARGDHLAKFVASFHAEAQS